MKKIIIAITIGVILAGFATSLAAHGRYHRSHVDFYFGSPLWWHPRANYWYDPFYYEPRTIIIEREPRVYIQRPPISEPSSSVPGTSQVWHYCQDPAGYYPYVPKCTQPWVNVDPKSVAPPAQ